MGEEEIEMKKKKASPLSVITIEPMMLLYALATNVIAIPNVSFGLLSTKISNIASKI